MNLREIILKAVGRFYVDWKFPDQLKPELEEKYLRDLSSEDSAVAKFAGDKLIEHNMRLVATIAKKYYNIPEYYRAELIPQGATGLVKALKGFDIEKNTKFSYYAARCIENEILMYLRSIKESIRQNISLSDTVQSGNSKGGADKQITIEDILESKIDINDIVDSNELLIALKKYISELPPREQLVINSLTGFNGCEKITQQEVAGKLGICRSYVSRIYKRLRDDFKTWYT